MSIRIPRLNFFSTVLVSVVAAASSVGCDEPPTTEPPFIEPPVDPEDQTVILADVRPPPISGGTLLVTKDGSRAIASDPDRDRILVVDLNEHDVLKTIALEPGDEPGRVAEDSEGRVHVALRRGGALVTLDAQSGEQLARRSVCTAPRGVASFKGVEGGAETVLVACATGELVELEAAPTGGIVETVVVEPDLRDVVVTGDGTRAGRRILISSFRTAQVITVGPDGEVQNRSQPPQYRNPFTARSFAPTVAWKMVPTADGAAMIHQRSATVPVEIEPEQPDGYGGTQVLDCGSTIINAAVSRFDENGQTITGSNAGGLGPILLPVDIATAGPESHKVAMVAAGSDQILIGNLTDLSSYDACDDDSFTGSITQVGPEPIAADFGPVNADTGQMDLVVQIREPAGLVVLDSDTLQLEAHISLGGDPRLDSGHQLFHRNPDAPTTISCASCHPEGGDDSHTWVFTDIGARRTQSLRGDVTNTAPFHWDGDLHDMGEVMTTVFEHRMGGFPQSEERVDALKSWLAEVPNVGAPSYLDPASVARGKSIFESEAVGCATCHSGEKLTNNATVTIGKGKATQVPSLVGIRNRAPFMHDGCATTLESRFEPTCGGTEHGDVSGLSEADIADLVAYMHSL